MCTDVSAAHARGPGTDPARRDARRAPRARARHVTRHTCHATYLVPCLRCGPLGLAARQNRPVARLSREKWGALCGRVGHDNPSIFLISTCLTPPPDGCRAPQSGSQDLSCIAKMLIFVSTFTRTQACGRPHDRHDTNKAAAQARKARKAASHRMVTQRTQSQRRCAPFALP